MLEPNCPGTESQPDYKGFWTDFTIADIFGEKAVNDTYNRAFREWKESVEYFASLVLTLNHRLWMHYESGNEKLARLYDRLWKRANSYGYGHFKGKELQYYHEFLD